MPRSGFGASYHDPVSYQFSLIRFVPDPARGEFVNIGAIAGSDDSGDWDVRLLSNYRRAKALDPAGVLPAALGFAAGLDRRVAAIDQLPGTGSEPVSLASLRQLAADMQNIVQLSPPAPVVAETAEGALDLVFDQLIVDPSQHRFRFEKKHRAQGEARKAYRAHDVPKDAVQEGARVSSGAYGDTFDFAVHNGRALQLVQCWSFQLPDQEGLAEEVKSWSWVVHELRSQGGSLATAGGELEIVDSTEVAAVCILPVEGSDAPAYAEAVAAFEELGVEALTPEQADRIGATAAALLAGEGEAQPQGHL